MGVPCRLLLDTRDNLPRLAVISPLALQAYATGGHVIVGSLQFYILQRRRSTPQRRLGVTAFHTAELFFIGKHLGHRAERDNGVVVLRRFNS